MANGRSFKSKLILSYFFVISVSFVFLAFFLDKNLEENSLRNIEDSLIKQAYLVGEQVSLEGVKRGDTARLDPLAAFLGQKIKCRITIINTVGKVVADSERSEEEVGRMENHLYRPEISTALTGSIGRDTRYSATLKIDMLYVALPLKDNDKIAGVLRLALPLKSVKETLGEIRKTILIGLLFAVTLAFVLGSVMAGSVIEPINRMTRVSRGFSKGDFSRRIIQPSRDEIGELADTLNKMAQDIEDKVKEAETQNQKLSAIFNSMIEGVVVVDKEARIISLNPTIEKIFGVKKEGAEGRPFLEAVRNNDISEVVNSVLKSRESASLELTLVYPVQRIFEVNATPIFDDQGVAGCLAVIHDITEIRRLETVRRDFVANLSHELKTPLTSIKGFIETLIEGAVEDRENNREFLGIIKEHAERLENLVNDLLSLSRLESKDMTLDKSNFSLREQVEEIIRGFRSQLNRKNINIENSIPSKLSIRADKERIRQVFINLLDNAIKFNKENGRIKVYSQELSDNIKITVEDTGIGIPERDVSRIFERFYRVDKARSSELGGTGLGLSIVKHIIELHQGTVGLESAEGAGSSFFFTLPR